jgi:hypothetical protein
MLPRYPQAVAKCKSVRVGKKKYSTVVFCVIFANLVDNVHVKTLPFLSCIRGFLFGSLVLLLILGAEISETKSMSP